MKKTISFMLALGMLTAMTACSSVSQAETPTQGAGTGQTGNVQAETELNAADNVTSASAGTEAGNTASENSRVLIAYFSRWGNTDYASDVDATTSASIVTDEKGQSGTTGYMADMIQELTGGTLHLIQTESAYSTEFDDVVAQNHDEAGRGVLPALKASDLNMADYDVIFIGYPIWATDAPQAVSSFLQAYDFTGKKVIPFCTHDGYGAGSSYSTVAALCPGAKVPGGLAVEAKDVPAAKDTVKQWVEGLGITAAESGQPSAQSSETAIRITVGDQVLDGVLYDNAEAQQFIAMLPQTVSMSGFGGREFYGGIDGEIETRGEGQYSFEDGQITYCPANNTAAIFYAQTSRPNLTMEVFPMGIVTSDLSVFDQLPGSIAITFSLAE